LLANLLIGLREGLEAALIVGILVAYLKKLGQNKSIKLILIGVLAAILLSIGAGLLLSLIVANVEGGTNQIIGGATSIVAVAFVTWMIFWMNRQSRQMSKHLRSKVDVAVEHSALALVSIAFFAVIREGIETAIFLWSTTRADTTGDSPILGAILGLLIAAALGYGLYRGSLKINLSVFFRFTGAFLILVAAGILAYGIMELQELNWLPLASKAYDISAWFPSGSLIETLLHGTVSFNPNPSILEVIAWSGYLVIVSGLYIRASRKK